MERGRRLFRVLSRPTLTIMATWHVSMSNLGSSCISASRLHEAPEVIPPRR